MQLLALVLATYLLVDVCSSVETELHKCTSIKEVKKLLRKNINVNALDEFDRTALHFCNDVEIAKLLVLHGADVNAEDFVRNTPLHGCKDLKLAKLLVKSGANVNARDVDARTPLHNSEDASIARFLLDKGAYIKDIDALDNFGRSALFYAVEVQNDYELVELLLKRGADPNQADCDGQTPLHKASHACVSKGIEELLVEKGANIMASDKEGRIPLHSAAGWYPCDSLHDSSLPKIIRIMSERGYDINTTDKKGRTAVHYAITGRGANCINLLVDNGADMNAADNEGKTPWYLALQCNSKRDTIVQWMINQGADVATIFFDGSTPLHLTTRSGAFDFDTVLRTIHILISRFRLFGVDIEPLDAKGTTPLFVAMNELERMHEAIDAARFLLAQGASIEQVYWIDRTVISEFHRKCSGYIFEPFYAGPGWREAVTSKIEDLTNKLYAADIEFNLDDFVPDIVKEYQAEVERLKSSVIFGTMSHYDFLRCNDPSIANEISKSTYDIASLPVEFRAYGNLLKAKIKIDSFRAELLLSAIATFSECICESNSPYHNMPEELIVKILSCLTNDELVEFIQSVDIDTILAIFNMRAS